MKRDLWVVVPVKKLRDSKTRLRGALDDARRLALVRQLLRRTLRTVRRSHRVAGILVVSRDLEVLQLARREGASVMRETGNGLNAALAQAAHALRLKQAMLVLPLDLPMLDVAALDALLPGHRRRAAALAPDRAGNGTNALLLQPPGLMTPRFGPDSFAAHRVGLAAIGVQPQILREPGLALDIDTPADLDAWRRR